MQSGNHTKYLKCLEKRRNHRSKIRNRRSHPCGSTFRNFAVSDLPCCRSGSHWENDQYTWNPIPFLPGRQKYRNRAEPNVWYLKKRCDFQHGVCYDGENHRGLSGAAYQAVIPENCLRTMRFIRRSPLKNIWISMMWFILMSSGAWWMPEEWHRMLALQKRKCMIYSGIINCWLYGWLYNSKNIAFLICVCYNANRQWNEYLHI